MKKAAKKQHGGKRKSAGRKPVIGCKTCAVLLKQLDNARAREARLLRQIESKDQQIATVITAKFETFHSAQTAPESSVAPGIPLNMLNDVETYDDTQFVEKAKTLIPEKTN